MQSTHILPLVSLFSVDEQQALDAFCAAHCGEESLPELADFLAARFDVEVSLDPDIVTGFVADSSNLPGAAQAVARPQSERECAVILRACHQAGIPVTLSAGKSNLTGSATPQGGVVLSTVRMLEPAVKVNNEERTAVAPVGQFLEEIRNEVILQSGNLCFPVDPTSRTDACLGGCIACNASGFTPGPSGSIRHWVDSIHFLFPDGSLLEAVRGEFVSQDGAFLLSVDGTEVPLPVPRYSRPAVKNAGGPFSCESGVMDFVDFVIGSEGIFGLVTQCKLKLAERPSGHLDLFISLPAEGDALSLLKAARDRLGPELEGLSAFEYFGVNCRKYMNHEDRFFHGEDQVAIYIQEPIFDGDMLDAAEKWLEIAAEAELDIDEDAILILDTEPLRDLFLEARHSMPANALEVVQHRGTFTIMTDCVVPFEHFPEFLAFTHDAIRQREMDYLSFGHLGDCHLHFTILPEKEQVELGVAAYDAIVAKSAEFGGVYSGEHGTGKRKRRDFLMCHGEQGATEVLCSKRALDPLFLLNRDVVVESPGL